MGCQEKVWVGLIFDVNMLAANTKIFRKFSEFSVHGDILMKRKKLLKVNASP